jgi:putative inorganic carbon (HCO3(-)) transporter
LKSTRRTSELALENKNTAIVVALLMLVAALGAGLSFLPPLLLISIALLTGLLFLALLDMRPALLALIVVRINMDAFHNQINLPLGSLRTMSLPSTMGVLLLLIGFLHIATKKVDFWRYPLVRPFCLFFLACTLSLPSSGDLFQGIMELSELLSFLVLFILVVDVVRSERDVRTMIGTLLLSSLIPLTVGLVQIHSNINLFFFAFEPSFRVHATLTHPNAYAFYLVMMAVLSISVYLHQSSEGHKLWLRFLIPLLVFSLVFTYTRGAWIGLVIAVFCLGVLGKRTLLVVGPLALYGILLAFPLISQRFESILNPDLFRYDSLTWRLRLWGATIPYFFVHPLFGGGLGTFQLVSYQVDNWFAAAHNDYLRILVETGLVGLSGYMILMLSLVRLGIRALRRSGNSYQKPIVMGFLCFLISYLAMSVADNLFNHGGIQWYFWAYAGVVAAIERINAGEDKRECRSCQKS